MTREERIHIMQQRIAESKAVGQYRTRFRNAFLEWAVNHLTDTSVMARPRTATKKAADSIVRWAFHDLGEARMRFMVLAAFLVAEEELVEDLFLDPAFGKPNHAPPSDDEDPKNIVYYEAMQFLRHKFTGCPFAWRDAYFAVHPPVVLPPHPLNANPSND